METLSASLEDYLELICNLYNSNDSVKAVEISKIMNISRASVSEALTKLAEKKLIFYEGHKGITITEEGLAYAKNVILKHNTFSNFFEKTLGLDSNAASENACKIEHVVSDELFNRLLAFQLFCEKNKEVIDEFKKGLEISIKNE